MLQNIHAESVAIKPILSAWRSTAVPASPTRAGWLGLFWRR